MSESHTFHRIAVSSELEGVTLDGRYRLETVLGRGGMGVVWRAADVELDRPVAVKVLAPQLAFDPESIERFGRERTASERAHNEGTVQVLDGGHLEDGRPFMVLELLEGRDLAATLHEHGPCRVADAVDVAIDIALVLHRVHRAGVVHRDIKPANVFLARRDDERTKVMVLDFGIAKLGGAPSMTDPDTHLGTPRFVAPEQMMDPQSVDQRTDVYGIGATLYTMLCGETPFAGANVVQVVAAILRFEPVRLETLVPHMPRELADLVHRAFAKNPWRRPASALELARELAPFASTRGRDAVATMHDESPAELVREEPLPPTRRLRARAAA